MVDIVWWQLIALMLVGIVSGFLNILAGGGSLLTLPLLIFLGLPAAEANGTNRVAIVVQNIAAIRSYRSSGVLTWRLALLCSIPAIIGACIGAQLAVTVDEQLFRQLLAAVMVLMVLLTTFDPARRYRQKMGDAVMQARWPLLFGFFIIGIYGGFIQAGVGFLILSVTMLAGLDLVRGNVLKVVVILVFNIPALAIFAWNGQVDWLLGSALASGNAVGALLAAKVAVAKGHDWIRRVVTLVVLACALRLIVG
ncbi:MAG: sulfite exporter TauE/SafE family protein [Desulfuromonas sp.]|nr:sulfite exporter TauE/SafE family protein [Desulfuromonas sp.]